MDIRRLSASDTAYILGVGYGTLRAYREAGIPFVKEGKQYFFDAQTAVKWYIDRLCQPEEVGDEPVEEDMASPKDRALAKKYLAEARLRQIELAERRGQLVTADSVTQQWRSVGHLLAKKLQAVEKAFGADVGNAIRTCLADAFTDLKEDAVYKAVITGQFVTQLDEDEEADETDEVVVEEV